jgi:hypothetical protein
MLGCKVLKIIENGAPEWIRTTALLLRKQTIPAYFVDFYGGFLVSLRPSRLSSALIVRVFCKSDQKANTDAIRVSAAVEGLFGACCKGEEKALSCAHYSVCGSATKSRGSK